MIPTSREMFNRKIFIIYIQRLKEGIIMTRQQEVTTFNKVNYNTIKSKLGNKKILRMALCLGLLSPEKYQVMIAIGESKELDELVMDMTIEGLEKFEKVIRDLAKERLISLER
ncbi:MAG: hypothetical protein ACTSUE_24175 [Promethearchaeota archaeon]